jgi:uncharacterized protein (DUF1501 family)
MKLSSCAELSRRSLLGGAAALGGLAGAGLATQMAFAAPGYTGDTLVVLSLHGGFDGLSALVPIADADYYRARPAISVPKSQVIAGDGTFGLHPALAPLLPLWTSGKLGAVHAVGQQNPTRSHFAAMEAMENAAPGTSIRSGWLDRMLGVTDANGPLAGVSVGGAMPNRLFAGPSRDVSMASVDKFSLPAQAADRALAATAGLRGAASLPANGAVYPKTDLGDALRDVARLIKAKVGLATAAVDCGDWDMHDGLGTATQGQRMHDNLHELALALAAFATDLGPEGLNSVTLLTISEFGRRVAENGSHGADHGHGNAMFLLGGGVRGGKVYAKWPGLAPDDLLAGDLAVTTDYRAVIGELLQKRCGVGSLGTVFPSVTPSAFGLAVAR